MTDQRLMDHLRSQREAKATPLLRTLLGQPEPEDEGDQQHVETVAVARDELHPE